MTKLHNGMNVDFETTLVHEMQREPGLDYRQVSGKRYLAAEHCREQWQVDNDARHHPRGVRYYGCAAARAVAHAVERPNCIVAGFSALALYGLPYLVEGADTTLLSTTGRNQLAGPCLPTIRRCRISLTTWSVSHRGVSIQVVHPLTAVVQALVQVKRGEHRWKVVAVDGLGPEEVRAVQLIDCVRRFWGLDAAAIEVAARHKVNAAWLRRVLRLSSARADSPKETEMRLLVGVLAARYGYTVEEQVPLIVDGKVVTVFDLAIPELKIAVMYDGEHHSDYKQRNKDASINIKMTLAGWTPARCSSGTMFECLGLIEELMQKSSQRN